MPTDAPGKTPRRSPEREGAAAARGPDQPPEDYPAEQAWPLQYALRADSTDDASIWLEACPTREAVVALCRGRWDTRRDYGLTLDGHPNYMTIAPLRWRERELHAEGTRQHPVWFNERWWVNERSVWRDHFVHMSPTQPGLLCYTQDNAKGQRDIQTPTKVGRYLTKFFSHVLTEKQILAIVRWQTTGTRDNPYSDPKRYELRFADTPDGITKVYRNGPRSCMSGTFGGLAVHPASIYGAGDLAVAYMADLEQDGKPVSRALVRPARHIVGRVYPTGESWQNDGYTDRNDVEACRTALENALRGVGYSNDDDGDGFDDARMLRVRAGRNCVVMPYLDRDYRFDDDGDTLTMNSDGAYCGSDTAGYSEITPEYEYTCDNCEEGCEEIYEVFSEVSPSGRLRGSQNWCEDCVDNHAFQCSGFRAQISFSYENSVELSDGRTVCEVWANLYCYQSGHSGDYFVSEDDVPVNMDDGTMWSTSELAEHGFTCAVTGQNYANSDMHEDHDGVWEGCTDAEIAAWQARESGLSGLVADARQAELVA